MRLYPQHKARRLPIKAPLHQVINAVRQAHVQGEQVGVLADGDPLLYGIGRRLLQEFDPQDLSFYPGVSALQAAASRLKLAWDDLPSTSLHGRREIHPVLNLLARHPLIGVHTDAHWSPDALARTLMQRGGERFSLHICQDMGLPSETIQSLSCARAADMQFSGLSFVIVQETNPRSLELTLGTPDASFSHSQGLITKREVRCMALGLLQIQPEHTLWDVGAGCGSVGLEASLLARDGRVVCIEKNPERMEFIRTNRRRSGALGVDIVSKPAPACFAQLPAPDRIVIGGGLSRTPSLVQEALEALAPGGRLLVLCTLLSTLEKARQAMDTAGIEPVIHQIQVSRSHPIGTDVRLAPLNPVFAVVGEKGEMP